MKVATRDKLLNLVKNNYQEIAFDFNATRKKEIWPEISRFTEIVKTGDRILDAGCGNGRLLEALKDKATNYLGVDSSSELIKLAQTNYPGKKFIVGDILNLDMVAENNFAYVFCLAVWQHIPSRELRLAALKQLAKKISPEGVLIISVWNLWQQPKYRRQLWKNYWLKIFTRRELGFNDLIFPWKNSRGEAVSERYYHAFTKKELKKLVRLAGLKTIELKRDRYNYWLVLKNKSV